MILLDYLMYATLFILKYKQKYSIHLITNSSNLAIDYTNEVFTLYLRRLFIFLYILKYNIRLT